VALETDEKEFWSRLEFRVFREIEKMPAFRRQRLWCDGFIPEVYLLGQSPQSIAGAVWIYQEEWRFRLFCHPPHRALRRWPGPTSCHGKKRPVGSDATKKEIKVDLRRKTTA
jgi:hypothetical protein